MMTRWRWPSDSRNISEEDSGVIYPFQCIAWQFCLEREPMTSDKNNIRAMTRWPSSSLYPVDRTLRTPKYYCTFIIPVLSMMEVHVPSSHHTGGACLGQRARGYFPHDLPLIGAQLPPQSIIEQGFRPKFHPHQSSENPFTDDDLLEATHSQSSSSFILNQPSSNYFYKHIKVEQLDVPNLDCPQQSTHTNTNCKFNSKHAILK